MVNINSVVETAISLPFTITSYGSVATTSSTAKLWSDRVTSVLGTSLGERIFNDLFGTEIPSTILGTRSEMEDVIRVEIRKAFNTFLPLLTLNKVQIIDTDYDNTVTVTVFYTLPNLTEIETTVGVLNLSGVSPANQELN